MLLTSLRLQAVSILPLTSEQLMTEAEAICRGTVLKVESFRDPADGSIQTRAHIRVDEALKGRFPAIVQLVHRGGLVGTQGEYDDLAPHLSPGEERLFFLGRRSDKRLHSIYGSASALKVDPKNPLLLQVRAQTSLTPNWGTDVTDQASPASVVPEPTVAAAASPLAPGFSVNNSGYPVRFTAPDRGEAINYLVDAQFLPAGITVSQALDAVKAATAAWTAATGVKFQFEGLQNFGTAAGSIQASDGRIRLQLHDAYGYITSANVLGQGGWRSDHFAPPAGAPAVTWGSGGNVAGYEFDNAVSGSVVLKHTSAAMQNLATFTEVLCHELGHVIGLAHSSENPSESNALLKQAIMYYAAHQDGRGATLGSYDITTVRGGYSPSNTPPFAVNRVMEVVTVPSGTLNVAGINQIELRGYDLQGTNLSLATQDMALQTGTFSLSGNKLKFTPSGYFGTDRVDPATSAFYDLMAFRFSDGTNGSPLQTVRVIWHQPDSNPSGSPDGLPNAWMTAYWGSANPANGPKRNPNDDWDGDGFTNLQEFLLGTSPTDSNSKLRITSASASTLQWLAKPYEPYEIYGTTNFLTWKRVAGPIVPTTTNGLASGLTNNGAPYQFFRVQKVP